MSVPHTLPDDFDLAIIDDDSTLDKAALGALRELAWRKASKDPLWFLESFWSLEVVGKGYQPFTLYDYQKQDVDVFIEAISRDRAREVRLKARQIGYTTETMGLAFWNAWFNPYHSWLAALQTEDDAAEAIDKKMKIPYSRLPRWLRERGPQPTTQNMDEFAFDNGSTIYVVPATPRAGRSKAVFGVILDESAFQEYAEELLAAMDPLCYGPMFIFSTANGMGNAFHDTWLEAQLSDSEWNKVARTCLPDEPYHGAFRPWHVVPGRNQQWYQREKRKYRGKEHLFYQEHPSTPEEAFSKSGRSALPMDLLAEHCWCPPHDRYDINDINFTKSFLPAPLGEQEEADLELWIWEQPTVERDAKGRPLRPPNYVISCDVSEGLDHGDRSSVVVINANTLEAVATFRGYYPVEDLGEFLEWLGYFYHTALIGPERNNHGLLPIDYLRRAQYPRQYRMDYIGQIVMGDRTPRYGWHTNKASKPRMIKDFVKALRDEIIILHDERLFFEAQTFIADGKGGYRAAAANFDDHVIGHLIAWQLAEDVGLYPIVWHDDTIHPTTFGDLADIQLANRRPPEGYAMAGGIGQRDLGYEREVASFFIEQG